MAESQWPYGNVTLKAALWNRLGGEGGKGASLGVERYACKVYACKASYLSQT